MPATRSPEPRRAIRRLAAAIALFVFTGLVTALVARSASAAAGIGAVEQMAAPASPAAPVAPAVPAAPIVNTTPLDFRLPGTLPNMLTDPLPSPENCAACHVSEITDNFAGTMMANAARDPLFRAALQVANADANGGGEICIRCHSPSAWLNGRATPTTGSAMIAEDLQGVACGTCHRLVSPYATSGEAPRDAGERNFIKSIPGFSSLMIGSAAMVVDRMDFRRGPYPGNLSSHDAQQSTHLRSELVCATCHEIDNPILSFDANTNEFRLNTLNQMATGTLFPIERTYSEWVGSAYNPDSDLDGIPDTGGVSEVSALYPGLKRKTMTANGPVTVCQDCHMPLFSGKLVTPGDAVPTRHVGLHQWAGGSAVWQKGIAHFWDPVAADSLFDRQATLDAAANGEIMLNKAAFLTTQVTPETGALKVTITNNTGHKLPTGYAEGRRMWLHVEAFNAANDLIAAWGKPTAEGYIVNPGRIYEIKLGLTPGFAQSLGRPDLAGEGFHFILNNRVFKDNRIPPRGWKQSVYESKNILPVGLTYAPGAYAASEEFVLPAGTTQVSIDLLFQAASGEYLDFLEQNANVAVPDAVVGQPVNWGQTVGTLRDNLNLDAPVVMRNTIVDIPGGTGGLHLPLIRR